MNRGWRWLVQGLGILLLVQLVLRLGLRLWPRRIPYGWAWLLENPWRRYYRSPWLTAEHCALQPTDRVLEVGCGSGMFTGVLAAHCAHLTALDIDPRYLAHAETKTARLSNVTLLQADLSALPCPDGSMDVIVLISVLTEAPRPVAALGECHRVLRPGGRIIVGEEMFAPEYVRAGTVDGWASAAGFQPLGQQGNAWAYLRSYRR